MVEVLESKQTSKASIWKSHIEFHKNSGLSIKTYCEKEKISVSNFKYWQYKYRNQKNASLIPIKLEKISSVTLTALCTVELSKGRRVVIHDINAFHILIAEIV